MNNKIQHVLNSLPTTAGVYFMKDVEGKIIYIGKAKNLKNRVSSYFSSTNKNLKTQMLVSNIDSIEYILTASEQDAFSLESNLIKQNQPKYNILLKDDKLFPYIRIDRKERFPQVSVVRRVKNDQALYFGPYVTGLRVGEIVSIIKSVFPIRQCKINFNNKKSLKRMCLFGDMGKCSAPCVGKVSEEEYQTIIDQVIEFLNGKNSFVKKLLNSKMNKAAEEMDFEQAIIFRNHIEMLERSESYILSSLARDENFDCFAIKALDEFICINVNAVRNGKTILDKNILLDCIEDNLVDALSDFLLQYYEINAIPQEILVNLSTSVGVEEILKDKAGKKVEIKIPQIGIKKRIMEQACKNVDEYLEKNLEVCKLRQEMVQGALKDLAQILGLNSVPYRIECYDISNISGKFNVASMVVFENGIPAKREYRKFKIKTVEGANDFLSMKEVLERRLKRLKAQDDKFKKPDLIIVDGGLGQLSSASESMRSVGIDIPLVALAKQEEEIFTLKSNESIKLTKDNNARKLVQRIRDEAHRFAITYHKNVRDKEMFKS